MSSERNQYGGVKTLRPITGCIGKKVDLTVRGPLGGVLGWLTNTICSAIVGLAVGAVIVTILHLVKRGKGEPAEGHAAH